MLDLGEPREFSIWAYTVSHGTLIIRSPLERHKDLGERVDLIFKNTNIIEIPAFFECDEVILSAIDGNNTYKFHLRHEFIGKIVSGALYIERSDKLYNQKTDAAPYL